MLLTVPWQAMHRNKQPTEMNVCKLPLWCGDMMRQWQVQVVTWQVVT